MSKKRLGVCLWWMSGDINSVTYKGERKRRAISFNNIKSEEFSFFIHNMELLDVLTSGKKFTWISVDGLSMSRFDCFLIFKDLFLGSNISLQWVGRHNLSDHCFILHKNDVLNYGRKSLRFFNVWIEHPGFMKVVLDR